MVLADIRGSYVTCEDRKKNPMLQMDFSIPQTAPLLPEVPARQPGPSSNVLGPSMKLSETLLR